MRKKTVVIGMLGTTLDRGIGKPDRWQRWRPTIALCQHEDFAVDRLELLVQPYATKLAAQAIADIASVSPETKVVEHALGFADPWDFSEVYARLGDFAEAYPWQPEREDYYLHITTGTHVAQICLFLLCETRAMPGRLLQSSPASPKKSCKRDSIQGFLPAS